MNRKRYPNFRHAQRNRGPFFSGPKRARSSGFVPLVIGLSCGVFGGVFLFADNLPSATVVSDQVQGFAQTALATTRNFGRERAPQVGDYWPNCDAARAAGVAPLYSREPGYREEMDGDGDGVACEPYRGRF